ncbi:hypothetical protein SAMN04488500_1302 [Sporomusa malonica]|uniref:Uncharacterized protein n=1 Tax=Sporomusa malonica TaxID=112901 RepID=A0A1W2ETM0_9FIRM|nr:hypothetical protein SAMN04488500_1302 [Sporomusa malonica]
MAQYKSKFVFGLCLATRTHIWHFYDALLYIVQFSGNDVHGCTSVTDVSWMIRFVRDRLLSFCTAAEFDSFYILARLSHCVNIFFLEFLFLYNRYISIAWNILSQRLATFL